MPCINFRGLNASSLQLKPEGGETRPEEPVLLGRGFVTHRLENGMNEGGYRVPGRDIDETEIEKEKIRQEGETKRKLIEEKEKTRRDNAIQSRMKWTDSGFQPMVGIPLVVALIALTIVGGIYANGKFERHPEGCQESSDIRSPGNQPFSCGAGGRMTTQLIPGTVNDRILVKCKCPPFAPDMEGDAGKP